MHNNCIATASLVPGMVIVQVTKQNGPLKIRKSGLVTSVEMIQGLIEMGIQEVQIDPTQTVEIETPVVHSSATLQLLQSGSGIQNRQDSQLHDQFNRSLFLPSVQDIPSAWQVYAKRYTLLLAMMLGGFAFGFAIAYIPNVLSLRSPLVVTDGRLTSTTAANVEVHNDVDLQHAVSASDATLIESAQNNEPVVNQSLPLAAEPVQKVPKELTPVMQAPVVQQTKPVKQDVEPAIVQESVQPKAEPEPQPQLSPELLKRFETVIKQMDKEAANGQSSRESLERFNQADSQIQRSPALTPPTHQSGSQNVPRIDQLPAWVMNELPSMSFSAHMFASNPADRWVRVNGQRMLEGDVIDNKVRIIQIASQHVILNYQGHEFSMMAMTDW
ncbi:general secretion pathway protein GspB [Flavobacterium sp. W21_SRS_FM6]|uniref:general secretion pathway protein GspB n=1 Tax=Flavobacterium sp. W21_SRS_FM6 TaxID=3240268 RepID=UPI003F933DF7